MKSWVNVGVTFVLFSAIKHVPAAAYHGVKHVAHAFWWFVR